MNHSNDTSPTPGTAQNLVDRASASADQALEATRRAADATIDSVADTVHGLRDRASPALDRFTSPYDRTLEFARDQPGAALLTAAATGAAAMALLVLISRLRH